MTSSRNLDEINQARARDRGLRCRIAHPVPRWRVSGSKQGTGSAEPSAVSFALGIESAFHSTASLKPALAGADTSI